MVPGSLSPSGPLHVGNGPMGTFFQFFFSAIFSYDLSRFYFWALGVPLLVGPWGLINKKIKKCFQFLFLLPYFNLSRFCFWALGVPLLVGPWGLGLGLGLGSGYGFSILMYWTEGPLQDALVFRTFSR